MLISYKPINKEPMQHFYLAKNQLLLATLFIATISIGNVYSQTAGETRKFTSTSGKIITGKIVSGDSESVTLQLEAGNTITGGIQFFSGPDREYINNWIRKNPAPVKFQFEAKVTKRRSDRKEVQEGSVIVTYETWKYMLEIENRSRTTTKGAQLDNVEVHYNIFKQSKADANRSSSQKSGRSGKYEVITGKSTIGSMAYLDKKQLETKKFQVNESELAPGYYYSNGSKDNKKDDLEGIICKVIVDGKVVFEDKSGSRDLDTVRWVKPN